MRQEFPESKENLDLRDHVETEVKRESLGNQVTPDPQEERDQLVMTDPKETRVLLDSLEILDPLERWDPEDKMEQRVNEERMANKERQDLLVLLERMDPLEH